MKFLRLCCSAMALVAIAAYAGSQPVREVDTGETFAQIARILAAQPGPAGSRVWIDLLVDRGDFVTAGQKLAIQRDMRGNIVQVFSAGVSGEVEIIARREQSERRGTVLEIRIHNSGERVAGGAAAADPSGE